MPCGDAIIPAPKLFTRFPSLSNLSTGSSVEPMQLFAPHRSATQMLTPSLSMSTALVDPHFRPSGIFAQPSTAVYGLGASLVGLSAWARGRAGERARATNAAAARNFD